MKPPLYNMNLGLDVVTAIGAVSSQWSALEYYLARITDVLCRHFDNDIPKQFQDTAFSQRRMAFWEALSRPNIPPYLQEYGVGAIGYIERVENNRHMIVHGMASETEIHAADAPPEKLIVIMRDHPRHYFTGHFTVAEIQQVAERISEANGVLFALYLHLFGVGPALPSLDW